MSNWVKIISTINSVSHSYSSLRYLKKIGAGSFATVFEVQNSETRNNYALKVINKDKITNSNLLRRINQEIHIHKSLDSPFIIKYHKSWETDSSICILLELAKRGDLFTVWRRQKILPDYSICKYLAQIATALDYMHQNEVVYRDLKLENVLLSDKGEVKLSDFGLAGKLCKGKHDLTFCGTMEYMSPEMLAASFYSHSTDFWSLGVLAYSLIFGRYPYQPEATYNDMINKVLSCRPSYSSPSSVISQSCKSLLDGLLEVSAKKRIASLDELKEHAYFRSFDFSSLREIRRDGFQLGSKFPLMQHIRNAINTPMKINMQENRTFEF
ncbi:RAC family serine/threonine-protein kinase-like [Oopsacas minuta]|uniref:RAC family serine/threonine-protein kinase-like n=1 Tax=Oopsacas minuta TaxID=111878 RepID=A0AAV7JMZ3_9METZ|nr:RAC family serine/threonine-protein kinase-like [Oopsacas minuta]